MIKKNREYKKYFLCQCPNPEHKDSHPSAILWKDSGMLICMTCGHKEKIDIEVESEAWFDFSTTHDDFKYFPLSERALNYLNGRGVYRIPEFVFSNSTNSGVSFLQRNLSGQKIGLITRIFNPAEKGMRYSYEGRKAFFTGNLHDYFSTHKPIIAFEKVFSMLRASQIDGDFIPVSTNGVNVNPSDWMIFPKSDVVFVFDNDRAGLKARDKMRNYGFAAFISKMPSDEINIDRLERLINNAKSLVLR